MTTSPDGPPAGRRPNRRGEGIRLRDEIVRAATRLLQRGHPGGEITLRAVAREAGIAAPSIYGHFTGVDAIIAVVVAEAFDALVTALRASRDGVDDPVQRLSAQCYAYLRFAEENPGPYRVLFARTHQDAGNTGGSAESRDAVIAEAGTPAFAILVDAVTACVHVGRSMSTDPFLDSVGLWSALHGYIGLRTAAPEFPWPDEEVVIDAMIHGLARITTT